MERLAAAALSEPNRHAAIRFLVAMLPEVGADLPGLRNSGLLATQELRDGVPARTDWSAACDRSKELLSLRGRQLVEKMGFGIEQLSVTSSVLTVKDGVKRAVAVFLDEAETFDESADRFSGSPVSHALALADREGVPWVVLTRARQIRLYAARSDTGVGRKGRAETFVEMNLALLPDDQAGYLSLIFSPSALAEGGTLDEIIRSSADFAAELAIRLRARVYFEAVPGLAAAVASRFHHSDSFDESVLAAAYESTLIILFRLLFLAYAEDKDLLPYRTNSRYADHALKTITRRLAEDRAANRVAFDESAIDLWEDVRQLWRAVEKGNSGWGVPGYDGGLFSDDPDVSAAGAALADIELTDSEFGPAVMALLVDEGPDGVVGPVDFRSLSVREFGTIYEGLLESMLSVAPCALTVDAKSNFVPAKSKDEVFVEAGNVYFHNRSGARKSTGSYFTKPFAVEHLLDYALEPALTDHLTRLRGLLDEGDQAGAADAFFDFRCVDLAMGSGHFLVAAVDRIESRLSGFLALNPIAPVTAELERLRQAANAALGDLADGVEIETTSLLRRQVARRCVYGVDLNHISVELARLAIWIHTFVPGLPLSFLDHNLVCGNSLTGIGTLDEAITILDPRATVTGNVSIFGRQIEEFLGRAGDSLRRLARITEATIADVKVARQVHDEALAAVEPARQLFDLLVAGRLGEVATPITANEEQIAADKGLERALEISVEVQSLHFPVMFPEVFLRERSGFDCVLGNPPWEEPVVEELQFWAIRFPGLKGMANSEQKKAIAKYAAERLDIKAEYLRESSSAERLRYLLSHGGYPGMGTGDPDLYKAFIWRFARLVRPGGWIGVVLPRSVFVTLGASEWRQNVLPECSATVVFTKNRDEWLFTDVNPGYPVALATISPRAPRPRFEVRGTYQSLAEFRNGMNAPAVDLDIGQLQRVDPLLCVPSVDSAQALRLFSLLIRQPPFGDPARSDWRARPHTELHATNDAAEFFTSDASDTPVRNHLNVGHFAFEPQTGAFNYTVLDAAIDKLDRRRKDAWGKKNSPFTEMPREWVAERSTLPLLNPRIAFRDVVHSTNPRKIWAALVPPRTVLTNKAPYLMFPRGSVRSQAYVLGVLGSSLVDWFGHLRVNLNLNYFILNSIPVPVDEGDARADRVASLAAGLALLGQSPDELGEWVDVADHVADGDREEAIAELDAVVSLLYDVPDEALDLVWNLPTRPPLNRVSDYRAKWRATK
ncbi:MAG: hypothetical protein M3Q30_01420 [Actinomycetota bacterium]|nr:hypothetical protein [Actinomycetota bacterium]